jgi:hypothetical protein
MVLTKAFEMSPKEVEFMLVEVIGNCDLVSVLEC